MRILALESSARSASIALLQDQTTLTEVTLPALPRTAQSLAPAIAELWRSSSVAPADLDLIAVTSGPGSFTGLRVGVTTAKTLAYALGLPVLGLHTLAVIASQAPSTCREIRVAMDAQRHQVFTASFRRRDDGSLEEVRATSIVDESLWVEQAESDVWQTGPALAQLRDKLPRESKIVEAAAWQPQAGALGRFAFLLHRSGRRDDLWSLSPRYYRASAAEEKQDSRSPL